MKKSLLIARDKLHTDVRTTWNILSLKKLGFEVYAISAIASPEEMQKNSYIYNQCHFLDPSKKLSLGLFEFVKKGLILRALSLAFFLILNLILAIFKRDFSPIVTIKLYIRILGRLLKQNEKYDLILSQEIDGGLIGISAHKFFGGKLIIDLHETYFSRLDHKSGLSFLLKTPILKFIFKKSDIQFVVSKGHLEFYTKRGFKPNAIVVPNVPFKNTFKLKEKLNNEIVFISQGSHRIIHGIRYVNTDTLITVWKKAQPKNAKLWLMHIDENGKTPKEFLKDKTLAKYGIIIKNPVKRENVIEEISKCDIGFVGYEKNMLKKGIIKLSSPNKIAEYLNAGLVILANDAIDFLLEIIEEFDCGFIFKNEEELSKILIEISQNPSIILKKQANIGKALEKHNYFNYFKVVL